MRGDFEDFLRHVSGIEDGLGAAFAVAQVDEEESAEVAAGMDPAGERDGLAGVFGAELVAMMRAFHVVKFLARPRFSAGPREAECGAGWG